MTVAVLAEEPTQASIRALLHELIEEVGPVGAERALLAEGGAAPLVGPEAALRVGSGVAPFAASGAALRTGGREPPSLAAPGVSSPPSVAYLLPGLPPEGSGGSHSLVQEARGLRQLGARSRVCVPEDSLQTAAAVYGNEDRLFVSYAGDPPAGAGDTAVLEAVADADVVVATEYPSVDLLARLARERPRIVCAYYVQDYEPLFATPDSSRSDRALLSYRAIPDLLLFAKTDWLCRLVSALHAVPVAKVAPSLDRQLFHPGGRRESTGPVHIAAMIRPRTPRRRPAATLQALAAIAYGMGADVRISTFGCDEDTLLQLAGEAPGNHLGLLSRLEVSQLMRRCDVFVDASAYQAFGRTGLEAMACGAVPVLPELGGVYEYARAENAVILERDSPREIADATIALARDPARLRRLREVGMRDAQRFSVQRAARSQLELFATRRAAP